MDFAATPSLDVIKVSLEGFAFYESLQIAASYTENQRVCVITSLTANTTRSEVRM